MKDLKEFILARRVKEWQIGSKKVPRLYIDVFNSYLEEIAEELAEHDKQIRKEVVQEIKKQSHSCLGEQYIDHAKNNVVFSHHIIIDTTILNQIENGGINGKIH